MTITDSCELVTKMDDRFQPLHAQNSEKVQRLRRKVQDGVSITHARNVHPIYITITLTTCNILLPNFGRLDENKRTLLKTQLLDTVMMAYLGDRRLIQWCPSVVDLYPVFTPADGNCLLHAVSLYLWGMDDKELLLRRLLYLVMADGIPAQELQKRWKLERRHNMVEFGYNLSKTELEQEWRLMVEFSSDRMNWSDPNKLRYESLEEIHIFALANIVRRPIIIIADRVSRDMSGRSLSLCNLGGVFLPLLWPADKTIQTPIVIGTDCHHFVPLIATESINEASRVPLDLIPLVYPDMKPFPIHFLKPRESQDLLLSQYLDIQRVPTGHASFVLGAKLGREKPEVDLVKDFIQLGDKWLGKNFVTAPLPSLSSMNTVSLGTLSCGFQGCKYFALAENGGLCSQHMKARQDDLANQPPQFSLHRPSAPSVSLLTNPSPSMINRPDPIFNNPELSIIPSQCGHAGCMNFMSKNTFPYCHEHSLKHSISLSDELPSNLSVRFHDPHNSHSLESVRVLDPQQLTKLTLCNRCPDKIAWQNGKCKQCFLRFGSEAPVVMQQQEIAVGPPGNAEFNHGPSPWDNAQRMESEEQFRNNLQQHAATAREMPWHMEQRSSTQNILSESTIPKLQRAASLRNETTSQFFSSPLASEETSSLTRRDSKRCRFPNCRNTRSDFRTGLCRECFGILSERKMPTSASHKATATETRIRCRVQGCKFYGDKNKGGYCSECHKKTKIPCRRHGCGFFGDSTRQGYCSDCFRKIEPVIPITNVLAKIELGSRSATQRCKTTGCPNLGNSRCKGYCNACFARIKL